MIRKYLIYFFVITWLAWAFIIYNIITLNIDEAKIVRQEGKLLSVSCETGRTTNAINVHMALEKGKVEKVYLPISFSIICNDKLIDEITNKTIKRSFYKNIELGVIAGGMVLLDEKAKLEHHKNKLLDIFFWTFVAMLASVCLYARANDGIPFIKRWLTQKERNKNRHNKA